MPEAPAIHRDSIVVDGHSDILCLLADRRARLRDHPAVPPAAGWVDTRAAAGPQWSTPYQLSPHAMWFQCLGQYDVPSFQAGGLTAQVAAVYVGEEHLADPLGRALSMVAAFHREIEESPADLLQATSAADIRRAKAEGKTAMLLSFEGCEPIGTDLDRLEVFYRLGLRMASLTHSRRNALADGTQLGVATGGLTRLGREAVRRMNELGIVVDLAHLADEGIWEVLSLARAPVVYSHCDIRASHPGYRAGLLEESPQHGTSKLRAIAATGGVVGVIFWGQPDVETIVDEVDAALQHAGEDCVALGSDFFGFEQAPAGLEDMGRLPNLTEALARRGYADSTIAKVLGGNWMRVFDTVLR